MLRYIVLLILSVTMYQLSAADLNIGPEQDLCEAVRQIRNSRTPGDTTTITLHLAPGTYRLDRTLVLRPEDSHLRMVGTTDNEGNPLSTLSGGIELKGWRREGKLWSCPMPEFNGRPMEFRQLYINGRKAERCRDVKQWDDMARVLSQDRENQVLYVPVTPALRQLERQGAQQAEMVLHEMWCISVLRIASVQQVGDSMAVRFHSPEARLQFDHPWPSPLCHDRPKGWNASPFYLTNHKSMLDQPGEWYLDLQARRVWYYPMPGEKITEAIAPAIETLIAVEGTMDRPATDIHIENIGIQHSTWLRPSLQGHVPLQAGMPLTEAYRLPEKRKRVRNFDLDNQGWLTRPAAAVRISGAKDVWMEGCSLSLLGSSGIDYEWNTEGGGVKNCKFNEIAGNGIVAGSFSPAALETHIAYDPSDRRVVVRGLQLSGNDIQYTGTEDWGTLAIAAGYVASIRIERNNISHVPYTAISLGWGWNADKSCMHDNRVADNVITHYAMHMYDCAGIYTLGNQPGSEITGNHVSDIDCPSYAHDPNHWFWLYTDEGSAHIWVHDNHCPSDKFLQNANGPCNVWQNNVDSVQTVPTAH